MRCKVLLFVLAVLFISYCAIGAHVNIDNRYSSSWECFTRSYTLTIAQSGTVASVTNAINGRVTQIHLIAPVLTSTNTMTLTFEDGAGNVLFDSGAKAEDTTNVMNVARTFVGDITVKATSSGDEDDGPVTNLVYIYGY